MQLAKLENGVLITTCADSEDRELINLMVADGFKYFVEEPVPEVELSEFEALELRHREEAHQIVAYYEVVDNSPDRIAAEITRLKANLAATDYQVIKSYEFALAGSEPPYDIASLHDERQSISPTST
ncbi:hypothetical protein BN938_0128 [Mucinivorans hirudinis]|uniref:Uncharacterized protein n=1 Tax=Mucinivorans hirudinis TaxID=1433126 RepID=A0A060R5V8_9BACT|nr:hypothetical protein BN938_0128 [Mucinivorans hirudinis]